jgi:2-methylcitrate dehydratase PrpD
LRIIKPKINYYKCNLNKKEPEIMGRLFLGAPSIVPRFRGASVFGPLGAASAAGKLFGLNEDQLANALGYAANLSSGLSECWIAGTMEGKFHTGLASRNGVMAAILGREGATAAESTFEGKAGFYNAFSTSSVTIEAVTKDLGRRFLIMEAQCKPYPVCGLQQVPVDLILTLIRSHSINPEDISTIVERVSMEEFSYPGSNNPGPFTTRFQAIMSAQFCAAASFLDKPMRSYSFYDKEYNDPGIAEMSKKIELVGEKGRDGVRIEVGLTDGRHFSIEGTGETILLANTDKTKLKFESLAYEFIGKKKGEEIVDIVLNLERLRDIRKLTAILEK